MILGQLRMGARQAKNAPLLGNLLPFVYVRDGAAEVNGSIRLTSNPNRRHGKSTVTTAATSMIRSMSILLWALVMR